MMRRLLLAAGLVALAVGAACELNPQPLPPSDPDNEVTPSGGFGADASSTTSDAGGESPNEDGGDRNDEAGTGLDGGGDAGDGGDANDSGDAADAGIVDASVVKNG